MDLDAAVKLLLQRVGPAFLRSEFASQLKADLGCKNMELVSTAGGEQCTTGVDLPAGARLKSLS